MPCDERVGRGIVTYPCTLDPGHKGPHYASDSPSSVGDRRRWEAEQAEVREQAEQGLAQFQGKAQTTAERYTDNPTPVPLSAGRRSQHRECEPTRCDLGKGFEDECPTFDPSLLINVLRDEKPEDYVLTSDVQTEAEPMTAEEHEATLPEPVQRWEIPSTPGAFIERHPGGEFVRVDSLGGRQPLPQSVAVKMLAPVKAPEIGPAHPNFAIAQAHSSDWPVLPQVASEHPTGLQGGFPTEPPGECEDRFTLGHGDNAVCRRTKDHAPPHLDPHSSAGPYQWWNGQAVPTKQREGDQVLPTVNDHPDIQSQVQADLEARRQVGISRYGTALQPFNGRDTLRDAYEEAMDLTVYLRSLLTMKEALRPELVEAVQQAFLKESQREVADYTERNDLAGVAVDAILDSALLFEPGPA